MIVLLANNSGWDAGVLYGRYPECVGHLYSPPTGRRPNFMPPYAIDNGRYASFVSGKTWDESAFLRLLETHGAAARWVVVPDVVGDRDGTLREWDAWVPRLSGLPLAMAVQDGMTAADVPSEASVVFIGGTTIWKRRTLCYWPAHFDRVHVGRINTEKWLWRCEDAGVESCDGTGWFRGDKRQFRGLARFLDRHSQGKGSGQPSLFAADSSDRDSAGAPRAGLRAPVGRQYHEAHDRPENHEPMGQGCKGAA